MTRAASAGSTPGFIVHNDRNYPASRRLLGELGVETQAAEMGMSIASADGRFEFANTHARAVRAALEPAAARGSGA